MLVEDDGDIIKGTQRTFYSVRLIALCCALAVLISGATGALLAWQITASSNDKIYQSQVEACERANDIRKESNARIPSHEADRDNLIALSDRLGRNRLAEAETFTAIGRAFHIEKQVTPLVNLLREASAFDKNVGKHEKKVVFSGLAIYDCRDTRVVPRP